MTAWGGGSLLVGHGYVLQVQGRRAGRGPFRAARGRGRRGRSRAAGPPTPPLSCARRSLFARACFWPTSPTRHSRSPRSSGSTSATPAALEQRINADLALGRHADVVAELEGLVAAHPLRERLRGQRPGRPRPLWPAGGCPGGLQRGAGRAARRAWGRAGSRAARAAGGDPAPGPGARACAWCVAAAGATAPTPDRAWPPAAQFCSPRRRRRRCLLAAIASTDCAPIGANVVAAIDLADGAVSDAVDVGPSPSPPGPRRADAVGHQRGWPQCVARRPP